MTPAERVRYARLKRGFSQYALNKRADLADTYVGMLERSLEEGHAANAQIKEPKVETLQKLADALDVPVEWLAFGTGPEPEWNEPSPDTERAH